MSQKFLIATTALLSSTSLLAHGPHAEVHGQGLGETLLHLLAHAWPVIPIAAVGYFFYQRKRNKA
ncbi:MAG: hypothetical protein H7842_06200 [Gammaproteobacteria bacterium SHHR-1]|uniref:hypothetical protein n=1 Tax=Magnetovirga frankeli TaxID=947516 RepID=UPI001293729A|nr:hypothetical protein D5125_03020 [gamma proteobacterium SS-5]